MSAVPPRGSPNTYTTLALGTYQVSSSLVSMDFSNACVHSFALLADNLLVDVELFAWLICCDGLSREAIPMGRQRNCWRENCLL